MSRKTAEYVVRVKVVTPHPLVASGIQALVEGTHGPLTVRSPAEMAPTEVVFYDATGLEHGGDSALDTLLGRRDSTVVAVVPFLRPDLGIVAARNGVQATIAMGASRREFLAVIEAAAGDELATYAASLPSSAEQQARRAGLTRREAEVLALIVGGHTNVDIAQRLSVSINSVKSFIRSAYRRMDVESRSQAVAWGIRHGFLDELPAPSKSQ